MKKILFLTAVCMGIFFSSFSVSAKEIYNSYSYGSNKTAEIAPEAVAFEKTVDSSNFGTALGAVTDLCFDKTAGILYAVDQTKHRIVKTDFKGNYRGIIDSFDNKGKKDRFSAPTGMFIDKKQNIYVADTGKNRIVELDKKGKLIRIIGAPESTILGKNFQFNPTHLVIDSIGRFYVISTGFNQGVLCLDENGDFLNCLGTPAVTFDLADYFWKRISTKEQKARMDKYVPTEYNNIAIDDEDFLYVTCSNYTIWDYIGGTALTLKKLNAKGSDIITEDNGFKPYGDRTIVNKGSYSGGSILVAARALDNDMICSVDRNRGKVFVYNSQSQLLFEFGSVGDYDGTFLMPTAVEYYDGMFAVSDSTKQNISFFRVNEYGKMLFETARLHKLGDYEAEEKLWSEIFTNNNNSTIALIGLANVEYRNGSYKESMEHFKLADDTAGYAKSFEEYRREMLNRYSIPIVIVLALLLIGIIVIFKLYKRHLKSENYSPGHLEASLEFGRRAMFRPMSHYWDLTWEGKGTMSAAWVIFATVEIIMILEAYCTGYVFAGKSIVLTNPVTVLFKMPLLLILYCICNWCVTSLMDGKAKFKQIWMANCYALSPIIVLIPVTIILSNFITANEGSFYHILVGLAYGWMLVLIICANKQIHDYEFGKSVLVLLITVLVMAVVIFLVVLMLALMQQMLDFGKAFFGDLFSILR